MNGKKISGAPHFFIGGVANPFVESLELHVLRPQKKIAAGVDFIQTQPVLDMERFKRWLNEATEQGLPDQCPIIAGVILLKSAKMARHLQQHVPGIMIPDTIIDRLDAVPEDKQPEEGMNICIERIEALKQTQGVKGVHIMAIGCAERLAETIDRAGLLPLCHKWSPYFPCFRQALGSTPTSLQSLLQYRCTSGGRSGLHRLPQQRSCPACIAAGRPSHRRGQNLRLTTCTQ
jgi:hypothetical protein